MKGLELCREYYELVGAPALAAVCPDYLDHCAVGLVGEGSECFGFDDEISRDHDWGPGFCIWLTEEDDAKYGDDLRRAYAALPPEYRGFRRLRESAMTAGRVGVLTVGVFYARFLGLPRAPETLREWRYMPQEGLATVTNGEIWSDRVGTFTGIRDEILAYYPEDLRRKKLAAKCALAAQAGQYNYLRCLRRGEDVGAFLALARFVENIHAAIFLLNHRYMPYYKWAQRALAALPIVGAQAAPLIDALARREGDGVETVERISALVIEQLRREGLSDADSDFLLPHAESVQRHIADPQVRAMHIMAE